MLNLAFDHRDDSPVLNLELGAEQVKDLDVRHRACGGSYVRFYMLVEAEVTATPEQVHNSIARQLSDRIGFLSREIDQLKNPPQEVTE